jgi:hypothetical protein
MFDLSEYDEFIFVIKNYSYADSPYVFLHRAQKADIDENGEVIFKITPEASKNIKPGAFYNFAVLLNAFNPRKETEYKKLTDNGVIRIEYGAQDLCTKPSADEIDREVTSVRFERLDGASVDSASPFMSSRIIGMRLEEVN